MMTKRRSRLARVLAVLFVLALLAAACGDDDDSSAGGGEDTAGGGEDTAGGGEDTAGGGEDTAGGGEDMDMDGAPSDDGGSAEGGEDMDMDGAPSDDGGSAGGGNNMDMNMGDPDATPASEVPGAEVVGGTFVLLDTRPEGYDDVTGTAQLARHDGGTTVTTEVSGLVPGEDYISHVHEAPCSDNGGDHYRFDPDGSDMPPNEIHLAFTADDDGRGFMTAENDMVAGDDAVAFVVHPVDLLDNKIACVDFG